ncbi:protease FtsH-inhibitory lysogeny factor CIII [uncultured Cedecea sp.]|nr:protease FtsH-inhibitory lysogeny factor CIII [uncultured Cedecea sp.]
MTFAISGATVMGSAQLNESQLDRVTRQLRDSFRNILRYMSEVICTQLKQ